MEIEIDKEQLIEFNKTLTGAAHRVIKPHQLDSVFSSYFYYEDIPSQIASIVNSIIKNHPFGDGNKRTAMMTLYYLTQTYDVIIELEEEKDEPKILDFDNIKWGVLTGVLLSIIVGFLILKPLDTSRDTWIVLCVILFCGFCFILGTVSEELGEYSELKKPHTTLYRLIGNFGCLIVVLFGLMYGMWGFVAGKVRIIDGGKREVVYKKDVFDYDSREVVK